MTRTHLVPTGTMQAALLASGAPQALAFDFDPVDRLANIALHEFSNSVLSRIAFACDAYINMAIQRALAKLKADDELEGSASWDSYQAFLSYAAGLACSEEIMIEAGMDVKSLRETVQKLFNVRTQIHDLLKDRIGLSYEVPLITDWMKTPRLRRDDADTMAKKQAMNRALATDPDTGVIDVDMEKSLAESMAMKDAAFAQDQLRWDRKRGELSALFFEALKIREDQIDTGYADEHASPFLDLDVEHQHKLLSGIERYVLGVLTDLARDRKIPYTVHAAAVVEATRLKKAVAIALTHSRFKNIGV